MNITKITSIIFLLSTLSCKKEKTTDIPTYISIQEIKLQDINTTHNITDAWVYLNDNLQGVYELPANFPVLAHGENNLRIKAGIKENGIAGTRITYPFYSSYIIENQEFNNEEEIFLNPVVYYLENSVLFENQEDFDGNGLNLETDSLTFSIDDKNSLSGNYGVITLTDSILLSEITTKEINNLPQLGNPIYLEIDYKSNAQFLVGMYINFPQSSILKKDLLWINPKSNWNKIYINLTSTISEAVGANYFKVFIGVQRDFSVDTNIINLDNIRIVY